MVNVVPRITLVAGFTLFLAASVSGKDIADYRLGDRVAEDIVTPVPLMAVDPDATEALKLKEAQRFPVIVRFDPTIMDRVENDLRDVFGYYRSNFLNTVEVSFNHRSLDAAAVALPEFQSVVTAFKRQHSSFPLSTKLADSWVQGGSESAAPDSLISRVHALMAHPIRPDAWPEKLRLGYQVRLVAVSNSAEVVTLETADARGANTPHANLLTLTRARAELPEGLPAEEVALARFVAIWLRPNCYVDVELTRQDRARHTDALYAADNYEAGQVVARAGQVVDGKILAALKQLGEKNAAVMAEQTRISKIRWRSQWLVAGLVSMIFLSGFTIWRLMQSKRTLPLLPAKVACPSCDQTIIGGAEAESSQQRDLEAEKGAGQARDAIRARVLPQLVQFLREKLVRGLISQRGELLDAQQTAAAEMAELERRLDELRTPLQERLRAYEKRISELEKALAAKGEENRELIIAKILLTRRQLEAERLRNWAVLN